MIKKLGGLHRFMNWDKPILTDSGGFQVFSLTSLRKIKEEGVYFNSHIDGHKIFMGPEESMQIQSNLASTIAMAFDECAPSSGWQRIYTEFSGPDDYGGCHRCKAEMKRLNGLPDTINPGSDVYLALIRAEFFQIFSIAACQSHFRNWTWTVMLSAVWPSARRMKKCIDIIEETVPYLPQKKPTYLMGVGTPANILEAVDRGVDFFDCVYPSRNGRHGHVYTNHGKLNLFNAKYELDDRPIEEGCGCPVCRNYSRAYIRHLLKAKEMLGMRLCVLHNLYFYNTMMEEIREAIEEHRYASYKKSKLEGFEMKEEN